MINKLSFFLCLLLPLVVNSEDIENAVNKILPPSMKVEAIADSMIDGIKAVDIGGLQPIYVTEDSKYFFYGDLYAIDESEINNLTDIAKREKRSKLISSDLSSTDFITFAAKNTKHIITVFTDVDCGYCRKFHSEIEEYNKIGITVNYVAFPRSGPDSPSYNKIVGAWCSSNPKEILTLQKKGEEPKISLCENHPVINHYLLGQKLEITGTPAIISESGVLYPGYVSASDLFERLESSES
jgi:thiol:disulfide interchange protein DsbC